MVGAACCQPVDTEKYTVNDAPTYAGAAWQAHVVGCLACFRRDCIASGLQIICVRTIRKRRGCLNLITNEPDESRILKDDNLMLMTFP